MTIAHQHQQRKQSASFAILDFLIERTGDAADVWTAYQRSFPSTSMARFDYEMKRARRAREKTDAHNRERHAFASILSKLKKDGLVKSGARGFSITAAGKNRLIELKKRLFWRDDYEKKETALLKIVMFDIPENQRKYRSWIRSVLKNLDFEMLQKSVWAGTVAIPEDFLVQLERLRLTRYVHIVAITKTGSLERL